MTIARISLIALPVMAGVAGVAVPLLILPDAVAAQA